jgi:hypothetical protein
VTLEFDFENQDLTSFGYLNEIPEILFDLKCSCIKLGTACATKKPEFQFKYDEQDKIQDGTKLVIKGKLVSGCTHKIEWFDSKGSRTLYFMVKNKTFEIVVPFAMRYTN